MRVLHVIRQMNRGGAETMIMNLYRNIDREKIQFDFLVHTEEPGLFDDEIRSLGGRIFSIKPFNGLNFFSYYRHCRAFFCDHPEIKIVHGHLGSCASLYLKAAKSCGCFTIAHSHNTIYADSLDHILYRMYTYPTRFIADEFFGCSMDAGVSRYGRKIASSDRFLILHNAIDLKQFAFCAERRSETRRSLGIQEGDILVGTVGRIAAQKNPAFILHIFEAACALNDRVRCLWVGTGELEQEYREKGQPLIASGRLIMTGVRNDIPDLLNALDAFVFPSRYEGLGIVAVEAQASGLPCLITDTLPVETDVTGMVMRKNLAESPVDWAYELVSAAYSSASNRFSPIEMIRIAGYDISETAKWLCDFYCARTDR